MAFLNPVASLCHRQHSALLFRNLRTVVVQAVGRVFATAGSDPISKPSGPIRYVQKPLPHNEPDGRRRVALEARKTDGWASSQPSLPNGESDGESNAYKRRGYSQTSRGRGNNVSLDPRLGTPFPTVKGKSTTRHDRGSKNELDEGGQDTLNSQLDVGEYLFDNTYIPKTHAADEQVCQPGRKVYDKDPYATARNYVISLLARGPQTEFNLRTKMIRKDVSPEVIDETIKDVQRRLFTEAYFLPSHGLQSDEEYAEIFAHSRWTDNTWGPKRIRFELLRRGISQETVGAALVKLFKTSDTAENQEDLGKWGMTAEASEHLIAQAQRRWRQGDGKIDVKRRRMVGWLQRRGFSWTIIPDVLKIIDSEEPT